MKFNALSLLLGLALLLVDCQSSDSAKSARLNKDDAHAAQIALASMEVAAGLEATLFASEPTLINPTNLNVDEKGRVWVIEALNYRNRFNPDNPYRDEGDRILILEDTDGDGKADKNKVYYQGEDINSALGIWVMGDKVIVSSSPNIFMFTDTDGDDKPDEKKVLFTNIEGWDHDHGAHAFTFGPDGRLYFNMGNEGVKLQTTDEKTVVDIHGRPVVTDGAHFRQGLALRCEEDGSGIEVLAHNFRNNFELAVDSYGSIWQSDNDDDGNKATRINFVMEYGNYGFTDEKTGAGWRAWRVGMHEEIPKRHWHLRDPGVVPNLLQTGSGSPTGILFYEGNLLPEVFQQQMIHCEPGHQVVRAYPVKKSGAGYTAEIVNIMKSKDKWFRPSDVCAAPDGSLLIADWYDPGVGGHKMGDVDRGRIYRIAPPGTKYQTPKLDLSSPETAATALSSPNLSTRYLAWRKLRDWGLEAEPALQKLWSGEAPHMRARALWLLTRIGKTSEYLQAAVSDANPDIRITGLRAARQLDPKNLGGYLQKLQNDSAPEVRREVAIALRYFPDEATGAKIWTNLARQYDGEDRWYLEALGIGADTHADRFFKAWLSQVGDDWNTPKGRDIVWRSRSEAALPLLSKMIADKQVSEEDMKRFFRAFHFNDGRQKNRELAALLDISHPLKKQISAFAVGQIDSAYLMGSPKLRQTVDRILPQIEGSPQWLSLVRDLQLSGQEDALLRMFLQEEDRTLAVQAGRILLSVDGANRLQEKLDKSNGEDQKEVISRLGWLRSGGVVSEMLLAIVEGAKHPITLKKLAIESLGNSGEGQEILLSMLEKGELEESLINTAALKLMYAWNPKMRKNAPKYLRKASNESLPDLVELAELEGDVASGKTVFESYCISCHQVKGNGINFGPDLSEIGSKLARSALYTSIIYPSAGINFGYEGFQITLKDGTAYQGFIESETEDEIALRMMGGVSQSIQKTDIASQEEMKNSLMLEDLATLMSQEELVDLVEYLSSLQTPDLLSENYN